MTDHPALKPLLFILLLCSAGLATASTERAAPTANQVSVAEVSDQRGRTHAPHRSASPTPLAELALRPGADWQRLANDMDLLIEGDRVLVEIRSHGADSSDPLRRSGLHGLGVHTRNSGNLTEAWVPLGQLRNLLASKDISVAPVRRPQPTRFIPQAGSVTSAGVAESGLDFYHDFGATGQDVRIAVIDLGFLGHQGLESSGDWPSGSQLRRFVVNGSGVTECAGDCAAFAGSDDHGTRVVELTHDSAPDAEVWAYRVQTVGEWYQAILHASDPAEHGGLGADIILAALSAPLDGIGDGTACPPIWVDGSGRCGTIAEAAEIAQARGSLVIGPAGNQRQRHWGGLFSPSRLTYGGVPTHDWGGGNLNLTSFCYAQGVALRVDLFWNDWQTVDQDYDLLLFRRGQFGGWQLVAGSQADQNGGAGQQPQEAIAYIATGTSQDCPAGFSRYGVMITQWNASQGPHNLQLFTNFELGVQVPERSLVFPADSAAVFTVGGLDLALGNRQAADYSGQGPVLAPGGGLPGPGNEPLVAKPDGMSFTNIETFAGPFAGTSAAVPHAAGVAAVLAQLRKEKPAQIEPNAGLAIADAMHQVALTGNNDLGPPGFDTRHGYGRIRLGEVCEDDARLLGRRSDALPCTCEQEFAFIPGEWHMVSLACDRRAGNNVGDTFGTFGLGTYGQHWGMFKRDIASNAYVFLNEASELNIGEAYWIGTNNGGSGSLDGLIPDFTEAFPIQAIGIDNPIGRGHLVSNPRRFAISLDEIRFYYEGSEQDFYQAVDDGVVRGLFWRWNPVVREWTSYNPMLEPAVLQPGEGVWLYVLDDVQIRIPARPASATPTLTSIWQSGWQARLTLHGNQAGTSIRLGMHPAAGTSFDAFKAERLTGMGNNPVTLDLHNPDLVPGRSRFETDVRPVTRSAHWDLALSVPKAGHYFLEVQAPADALANAVLTDGHGKVLARGPDMAAGVWLKLPAGASQLRWHHSPVQATRPRPR